MTIHKICKDAKITKNYHFMTLFIWTSGFVITMIFDAQCMKKAFMQFANNTGPDQPVHLCRLIWAFAVCLQNQ